MKIEALLPAEETNVSHWGGMPSRSVKIPINGASKMQNEPREAIDWPLEVQNAATIAIDWGLEMQNALHIGPLGLRKLKMQ